MNIVRSADRTAYIAPKGGDFTLKHLQGCEAITADFELVSYATSLPLAHVPLETASVGKVHVFAYGAITVEVSAGVRHF